MKIPLVVAVRGFEHSEALEAAVREHARKLELFHSNVTSCRVHVEQFGKHHHQGRQFTVRIDVRVPGKEIVVSRDHHEDVYVALRDAFDSARRQIEDTVREHRGQVKVHEDVHEGKIARLLPDEGYGFISTEDDRELYFSRENVVHPLFEHLEVGMSVRFIEDVGAEGPQAKRVSAGGHEG
ncbi:MAG TPA: HPF/RaiA family ribosome-associated protein [Burkholderiaceae bacterium]|nr:HPF/RaiA family ribosome-associated protein [Burkholderiaceae bacterium]